MIFRLTIIVLCCTTASICEHNLLSVKFLQNSARSTRIETMSRGGILYVSLDQLSRVFKISTAHQTEAQKLELQTDEYTIKLCANNPFVVITDRKQNGNVLQLPVSVRLASKSFYVPIEAFMPILDHAV